MARCNVKFFHALQYWNDYPQILRWENRATKHNVEWQSDYTACTEHYDAPLYSHLMMTAKMYLTWLGKQIQKGYRVNPDKYPLCNASPLREAPSKELTRLEKCPSVSLI